MKFTRVIAILLALLFALVPAGGSGTETTIVTTDGVWWQTLSHADKLTVVEGMLVGFQAGYRSAQGNAADALSPVSEYSDKHVSSASRKVLRPVAILADKTPKFYEEFDIAVSAEFPNVADRTFGTMVDRIDSVFDNHPKLAKLAVSRVFECAATSGQNCNTYISMFEKRGF